MDESSYARLIGRILSLDRMGRKDTKTYGPSRHTRRLFAVRDQKVRDLHRALRADIPTYGKEGVNAH